ncbi:hypothetical protein HYT00_03450 [Candidatus Giovannonibacteria bacterium]|nr:hypothetical protein [Candidatus Giovannonibacteria bacterium]
MKEKNKLSEEERRNLAEVQKENGLYYAKFLRMQLRAGIKVFRRPGHRIYEDQQES